MPSPEDDHDLIENYRRQNRRVLFVLLGAVGIGLVLIVLFLWPAASPPPRVVALPPIAAFRVVPPPAPIVDEAVTVEVEAPTQPHPGRLALLVDGREVAAADTAPWSFRWTPTMAGEHRLAVEHEGRQGPETMVTVRGRPVVAAPVVGSAGEVPQRAAEPPKRTEEPKRAEEPTALRTEETRKAVPPATDAAANPPGPIPLSDPLFSLGGERSRWKIWDSGPGRFLRQSGAGDPATWARHETAGGGKLLTYHLVTLPAGSYRLRCRARSGGGQDNFQLELKREPYSEDGLKRSLSMREAREWTEFTLDTGPIPADRYSVGVYSSFAAGSAQWGEFTDLRFERLP